MKQKIFLNISVFLFVLSLVLSLTACQSENIAPRESEISVDDISESSENLDELPNINPEINIAFLKGPTGMGSVFLLDKSEGGHTEIKYNYQLAGSAEEIIPKLLNKELDIAALPTNAASALYNKSEGDVVLLAVNNFGAFKVVSTDSSLSSLSDLKGRTVISAGQGATPEYAFNYVLEKNNLNPETDLIIEYKSEVSEAAAAIISNETDIVLLPEPFVTQVLKQVEGAKVVADISTEWEKTSDISTFTVGCVVARREFIEANKDLVDIFLKEYRESIDLVLEDIDTAAVLCERFGILKSDIAVDAIPNSNLTYIDYKNNMMTQVSGFLKVLYDANPQSVGGVLPKDDFYYQG